MISFKCIMNYWNVSDDNIDNSRGLSWSDGLTNKLGMCEKVQIVFAEKIVKLSDIAQTIYSKNYP